jgi:hypothetical protein
MLPLIKHKHPKMLLFGGMHSKNFQALLSRQTERQQGEQEQQQQLARISEGCHRHREREREKEKEFQT